MDDNKSKALAAALSQIEKQFGKGSIMRLGENDVSQDIQVVSTGSLGLDLALGIGGLPRGRIIEVYGPESSGKTTLTLQVIAEAQKVGGTAAFIDAEHALDPQYARKLGSRAGTSWAGILAFTPSATAPTTRACWPLRMCWQNPAAASTATA